MRHGSLFSGIGGFDLAAEWMGWENVFHCEWNKFGQKILKYYWPKSISYEDITTTDFNIHRGRIDILTGGFPCQPYSQAGKRLGKEDERHLWPEMLRAIREIQPKWVVGENVLGLTNWNGGVVFEEVQADLEAEGYEVQPFILPACAVNAPHRRDRVWFIGHSNNLGRNDGGIKGSGESGESIKASGSDCRSVSPNTKKQHDRIFVRGKEERQIQQPRVCPEQEATPNTNNPRTDEQLRDNGIRQKENERRQGQSQHELREGCRDVTDTNRKRVQGHVQGPGKAKQSIQKKGKPRNSVNGRIPNWENFPTQPPICSGNDGISSRLDGITFPKWRNESIKGAGNAIVPQVVLQIFKAIKEYEQTN